jgi:acyl-coenzyme A thioesterase PaaI-like protein
MDETRFPPHRELADATRRLIRAVRLTQADPDRLVAATALIDQAAAALEAELAAGPHSQLGFERDHAISPGTPPREYFPFSPVVGPLNPIAVPLDMEIVDLDELGIDGPAESVTGTAVRARVTLPEQCVGPPFDIAHGGVVAQLLDELLGVATIVGAGGGFTGRLTIHYRRPTPALQPLDLRAWVERTSGRKIVARGDIRHDGMVTAEADGVFIRAAAQLEGGPPAPLADAVD